MQISRVHTNQKKSMILFAVGAVLCVVLELAGVNALSSEKLLPSQIELPLPDMAVLAAVYAVFGIVVGLIARTKYDAFFYGWSGGQCQFLMPLILYYGVLHKGEALQIWQRSLCGIPYMMLIAIAVFGIKYLFTKGKKK